MNVLLMWTVALVSLCLMSTAHAQNVHGILRVVKGEVQIKSAKSGKATKARIGEKVFPKDVIVTGKDSRAKIVMVDNNEINISPDSQIEIQHYEYNPAEGKKDVLLNVIYGKVRSKVEQKYDGKTSKFQIKTPSAVAGVRGTDFITGYNRQSHTTQVVTFEGRVDFGLPGPGGSIVNPVSVTPGQQASNAGGAPPSAPTAIPKEELAKIDTESKNETPPPPVAPAGDKRQPAADEKKKDGAAAPVPGSRPPATDEKKKDGAAGPAPSPGARQPANAAGPAPGSSPGARGPMILPSDLPANGGGPPQIAGPTLPGTIVNAPTFNNQFPIENDGARQAREAAQKTKLLITICPNGVCPN